MRRSTSKSGISSTPPCAPCNSSNYVESYLPRTSARFFTRRSTTGAVAFAPRSPMRHALPARGPKAPLISPEAWFYPITTEFVLEQTKPFRDRLIPFCIIDPRTHVFGGRKHFVDLLRRYQDSGARGFGEHKWGGAIDDPRNIELIQACGEVELPVLFRDP